MSDDLWSALKVDTSAFGALLIFRTFPMVVALGLGPSYSAMRRVVGIGAFVVLILSTGPAAHVVSWRILAAYGYFLIISAALYHIRPPRRHRLLVFLLCAGIYFVIPGVLFAEMNSMLPLLGWELMLSVYSYETVCAKETRNLAGFLFFVLIDPTLAYSSRGKFVGTDGLEWRSVGRIFSGIVLLFASRQLNYFSNAIGPDPQALHLFRFVILSMSPIVVIYCAHVGLANLQIGMMRQLGYVVPERYVNPLAATSVQDFWARWNTYLGAWAKLHVFIPVARALQSLHVGRSGLTKKFAVGLGVVATFLLIGVIHDAYRATISRTISLRSALWFCANGILLLTWHALERPPRGARRRVYKSRLATAARRAVLLALAIPLASLWA